MTQEDKELLLKDLSARLPYGVKLKCEYIKGHFRSDELVEVHPKWVGVRNDATLSEIGKFLPYLRRVSSMTEEERKEYKHLVAFSGSPDGAANFVDWLNKKMFAYRTIDGKDMFELGLALEAPEGMYN